MVRLSDHSAPPGGGRVYAAPPREAAAPPQPQSQSQPQRCMKPRMAEGNAWSTMSLSKLVLSMPIERAGFALVGLGVDAHLRLPAMNRMGFHYVLRGELEFEGPDGVRRRLTPGDFICLPRGAAHALMGPAAGEEAQIARYLPDLPPSEEPAPFQFGTRGGDGGACLLSGSLQTLRTAADYTVPTLPEVVIVRAGDHRTASPRPSALCEAALHGAGASAFAAALTQLLFTQAVRTALSGSAITQRPDIYAFRFPRIAAAHRLMERHYHEPWTIERLAAAAGMAKSSFITAFTAAIGEPPLHRLSAIRLAEARQLLKSERMIAEVAAAVGYCSQAAFARAFRRRYGETPTAAREAMRRGGE